jgi:HK97 family phage portal protein
VSLFRTQRVSIMDGPVIPPRALQPRAGGITVTNDTALRHSAVWACLRLRADLISTLPRDIYRRVNGMQVEVPPPPVLQQPGTDKQGMMEWLYSTQVDLDRSGNAFGLITAVDGLGYPAKVELVDLATVSVRIKSNRIVNYRIGGVDYDPMQVWHEKQYTVSGIPVGLSPVSYAAWSIGQYLSAQQFALEWFTDGAIPTGELTNTAKKVGKDDADEIKARFKATIANRDLFVHGNDWTYKPIQAQSSDANFLETQRFGVQDIARFFGVPSDLIDGSSGGKGSSITYASISQRNLQLLIMNIGPAIARREEAISNGLLPAPRYFKLNADALLRMDPQARAGMLAQQINSRQLAPSEARELENRPPFTEEQLAEFDRLFGKPTKPPTTAVTGAQP